jgi:hypothetical protein
MATSRRRRKTTTSAKSGGTRKRKAASRGAIKGFSFNTMFSDALKPLLLLVGIFIGKFVHDLIEGAAASSTATTSGLGATAISIAKPAAILAGGLALKQFWKGDLGTYIGYGIAAYGGVVVAKEALNFNVLGALAPGMAGANLGLLAPAMQSHYPMNGLLGNPTHFNYSV